MAATPKCPTVCSRSNDRADSTKQEAPNNHVGLDVAVVDPASTEVELKVGLVPPSALPWVESWAMVLPLVVSRPVLLPLVVFWDAL